ncbi:MAG: molybdopterin-guanine dinucleotide biosynthesis protein B [Candidatus Bathyarchaeia archaeon]
MTRLVSVVGGKHSGKTTVIRYLISELKLRGYKVGSVKEMPNIQWVDFSGKDTWEHGKAGAEIVVATPLNETVFFVKRKLFLNEIMPFLSGFDYVILEGFEHEKTVARIVAAKDAEEAEKFSDDLNIAVSGLIAESEKEIKKASNLKVPIFNCKFASAKIADLVEQKAFPLLPGMPHCSECGYRSCYEFAKAIVAGTEARRNCPLLMREDVVLEVNGKMIPLKLFPRTIIANIVRGIVSSLKGIKEVREVKIIVRKDQTG